MPPAIPGITSSSNSSIVTRQTSLPVSISTADTSPDAETANTCPSATTGAASSTRLSPPAPISALQRFRNGNSTARCPPAWPAFKPGCDATKVVKGADRPAPSPNACGSADNVVTCCVMAIRSPGRITSLSVQPVMPNMPTQASTAIAPRPTMRSAARPA